MYVYNYTLSLSSFILETTEPLWRHRNAYDINVGLQLHIVIIVIYFENILQIFHKKPEGPNRDKWSSYMYMSKSTRKKLAFFTQFRFLFPILLATGKPLVFGFRTPPTIKKSLSVNISWNKFPEIS